MNTQKNISNQIFNYLEGNMSKQEKASFELRMSQDEFLRDAVEGFYGLNKQETKSRLEKIRNKYYQEPQKKRRIIPFYLAAAASLALLCAAIFFMQGDEKSVTVAQELPANENIRIYENKKIEKEDFAPQSNGVVSGKIEQVESVKIQKKKSTPRSMQNSSYAETNKKVGIKSVPHREEKKEILAVNPPPAEIKSIEIENAAQNRRTFSADVDVDEASSALKKSKIDIQHDAAKKIEFFDPKTNGRINDITVTTLPEGNTFVPNQNGITEIPYQENLNHIVVEGKRIEVSLFAIDALNPETKFPLQAKEEMASILDDSRFGNMAPLKNENTSCQPLQPELWKQTLAQKRRTKAAEQANIQGEVVLTFQVNKRGKPRHIKVEKSLGYGLDQEAIRLLLSGPRWTPRLDGSVCEVSVVF